MIESTNSAMTAAATRTTRASKRRAAANATARWREARREKGVPEAAAVDRAVTEAVAFCMSKALTFRDADGSTYISMNRIFRVAMLILMRGGTDSAVAMDAIKRRLVSRPAHDSAFGFPSLMMHEPGYRPPPRRGDHDWSEHDRKMMADASRPPLSQSMME